MIKFITFRCYFIKDENGYDIAQMQVFSGVPQGSHIGPMVFNIMGYDIGSILERTPFKIIQYADDIKILAEIINDDSIRMLQMVINRFFIWCVKNRLQINVDKTFCLSYGANRRTNTYRLMNTRIKKVDTIKDLGVIFDSKLKFEMHVQEINKKSTALFAQISRFCKNNNIKQMMTKMTNTYIYPIICYCSEIWFTERPTIDLKLEKFQKIVTRITLGTPWDRRHPNHLDYDSRLHRCNEITYQEKLNVKGIIFLQKMINGENYHYDSQKLISSIIINRHRIHAIFNISNELPGIQHLMRKANTLRNVFSLSNSSMINKRMLIEYFKSNRN